MRLSIRSKIILPFLVLLVFLGIVGTGVITARVTTATVAEFDGALFRASLLGNDHLAVLEAERVAQLRTAADTVGVVEAIRARDREQLDALLVPIQANAQPAHLVIRVLDQAGQELLSVPRTDPTIGLASDAPLALRDSVQAALLGRSDAQGDKYVFLQPGVSEATLYWVSPVRTDSRQVVGAILLGESLSEIADGIRDSRASELVFYDSAGHVVMSSFAAAPPLPDGVRRIIGSQRPVRFSGRLQGHSYTFLASDWTLREAHLGYLAVALNADEMQASVAQVRLILVVFFVAAALLTLLLGSALARRITKPIERLVTSTRVVSGGDLSHRAPVLAQDEIGYLAGAFNDMTESLQEKTRALEDSYFASIEALARAIDARDRYTFGHSARVAAISLEIASAYGLPRAQTEALRRGALLHDIGKIGVEDRILRKPGPLNDQELDAMRQHPLIGHQMLSGLSFLRPSLPSVLHHHERWDGTGYPAGLKDEIIPPEVRILALADSLDAMTSDRPYRKGLSFEAATAAIRAGSGTQFDPAMVEAFLVCAEAIAAFVAKKEQPFVFGVTDVAWLKKAA